MAHLRLFLVLVMTFSFGLTDPQVVTFERCPDPEGIVIQPNCTVHEVRVDPCVEAAENKPCKIQRGKSASIQFDYTPGFSCDNLESRAYWANALVDLPFLGMNTYACNYTSCPLQANQRQTYTYNLEISKKFPVRTYDVKWKFWNNDEENSIECCFLFKIKLVK